MNITGNEYYGASTNPVGDSDNSIKFTKDYNLIGVVLFSPIAGPLDIKPMMVELSYYEDIFNNFVSGDILVSDNQNLIELLNLHGNEYLRLTFGKDDNINVRIDKLFRVYKVSARQKQANGETENYIIHFVSDEVYMAEQYRISKSYKGKTVSDIISDIVETHLQPPPKKYNSKSIERTSGNYNFVVPNLKPFEAINWISSYAQSASPKVKGNDMLFFENAKGFNFYSLQTLFQQQPYYTYTYNPKNIGLAQNDNDANQYVFNILAYEILDNFDTLEHVSSGTFANRVLSIDPLTRKTFVTDFNYNNYQQNATSLNKNPIVNNLTNRKGDALYETPMSNVKVKLTNKGQDNSPYIQAKPGSVSPDYFVEDMYTHRKSQLSLANYTRIKVYIAGDPNVTVGSTINFNMKSGKPVGAGEEKNFDKFYSGKYLITAVRHLIQTGSYHTIFEIVKDSVPTQYNNIDNNSPALQKMVKGII